ncbi:methyltransferase domain-containing protein [Patescibacteria group bacterium]|nr:methyltransferase domain-containing protein [Patescibacteria group bacterium]
MSNVKLQNQVIKYFNTLESRIFYSLLRGVRHFGYYPKDNKGISLWKAQILMIEKLAETLHLPKGSRLLDAGCGEGLTAIYLAKNYGYNITGIDFNIASAQKRAKREITENQVDFQIMDYMRLDFPEETFDGVYTIEAFVHAPDYKRVLNNFYHVLKPQGKLVLFEYTMSPQDQLTKEQRDMAEMINKTSGMFSLPHFTHGAFPKILKEAGFKNVSVTDITSHVLLFLKIIYNFTFFLYPFIKLFKLQKTFINTTVANEFNKYIKDNVFKYVIVEAQKP